MPTKNPLLAKKRTHHLTYKRDVVLNENGRADALKALSDTAYEVQLNAQSIYDDGTQSMTITIHFKD